MFEGCRKLKSLPDISNWNIKNVVDKRYMFYGCNSLISIPDISKWDTDSSFIYKCFNCLNNL